VHLHSGLRILDAAKLRPEKVVNGKLLLCSTPQKPEFLCGAPYLLLDLSKPPSSGNFFSPFDPKTPSRLPNTIA
jgi:hypothetical protein